MISTRESSEYTTRKSQKLDTGVTKKYQFYTRTVIGKHSQYDSFARELGWGKKELIIKECPHMA